MKKIFKYLLRTILGVLGALILYLLVSILIPRAEINRDTTPFKGENWHNPYQGLFTDTNHLPKQLNANFHAHSNAWGPFANGLKTTPEALYDTYKAMNFDVICISDYQSINTFRDTAPDYIPVYEHGYSFKKAHQLSIGAKRVTAFDVMLLQNLRVKQYMINKLKPRTELLVLNHPKKWGGYSDEELSVLTAYDLFEVLNHYGDAETAWDLVLSSGRLAYIVGNDDSHDISNLGEVARKFTRVLATDKYSEHVLKALKAGHAYGVDMPVLPDETFEAKAERIKNLPQLSYCDLIDGVLFADFNQAAEKILIIGDHTQTLAEYTDFPIAFELNTIDVSYVRMKVFFPDGIIYYLNPIHRVN